YLPEALRNYLLRLGWGHGDEEIISTENAIQWFSLEKVGKAPSRFDLAKLDYINSYYIKECQPTRLMALIKPFLLKKIGRALTLSQEQRVMQGMEGLKLRAKTLVELADQALIYVHEVPLTLTDAAQITLKNYQSHLIELAPLFANLSNWKKDEIEKLVKAFIIDKKVKMGEVAQVLRASLTGTTVSPGVFEVIEVFGKEETMKRLQATLSSL
ncbi:MAG: hypothetical protein ACK4M7_10830, partial [Burkholderiales bacterium]